MVPTNGSGFGGRHGFYPCTNKRLHPDRTLNYLGIVGILTSLAAPTFSSLKAKNTMASSVNLFLAQLHMARSSAVARERRITLCPTANTTDCSNDYRAWQGGYLIFDDANKNRQHDPEEEIISYQEKANRQVKIFSSSAHRNRITFLPLGRAWFSNTTIRFCYATHPDLNRAIIISNNGRVRTRKKMADGGPITCS